MLIAAPALVGLAIYLLTNAALVAWNSALLLSWAEFLVVWIAERFRANVYVAACFLILTTFWLVQSIAQARDWPASQLHELNVVGDWTVLPALACVAVQIAISVRATRRKRRRPVRG